ncbi:MAG: DMT family transporter [Bacteroidota bacterium]
MVDLALSILCSSLIFVVFKLFATYNVQTVYAIVVNYMVACICGLFFNPSPISVAGLLEQPWFYGTVVLGILFIFIFNIMAKSSQLNGVGVTSVATKMSLVLPVLFAVFYYKEYLSSLQILGIVLALTAVYLASLKSNTKNLDKLHLWLPFLVFLGSGVIDTSIKFIQDGYLTDGQYPIFSATVFGAAAVSGIVFISAKSAKVPLRINFKNVIGGICLGIPNYFSIFFLLRALNSKSLNSASVFTLNNVAIVLFSTLLGILLFKEKLLPKNWLGILLAVFSIILVALF